MLNMEKNRRRGILSAVATYLMWGSLPLYWNLMSAVDASEILIHRIIWSFFFMLLVLILSNRFAQFQTDLKNLWRDKRRGILLTLAAAVISMNWLTYIWAVNHERVLDTSLGYYINPLMTIFFGMIFFGERLNRAKKISFILASVGIISMAWQVGKLPWVSIALPVTFATYGALKKYLKLDPFSSITIETMLMLPIAIPYFYFFSENHLSSENLMLTILLIGTGAATAIPLITFAFSANNLPLNVIGFFQYISPTLSLFLGIFFFEEPFGFAQISSFGFIWLALIIFTISEIKS